MHPKFYKLCIHSFCIMKLRLISCVCICSTVAHFYCLWHSLFQPNKTYLTMAMRREFSGMHTNSRIWKYYSNHLEIPLQPLNTVHRAHGTIHRKPLSLRCIRWTGNDDITSLEDLLLRAIVNSSLEICYHYLIHNCWFTGKIISLNQLHFPLYHSPYHSTHCQCSLTSWN